MAFDINGLTCIVPGPPGGKLYRYVTNDAAAVMDTYFDVAAAGDELTPGDIIIATFDVDGATPVGEIMVVTAATGATVTMGAIDALGT